jgi:hypothetical protein
MNATLTDLERDLLRIPLPQDVLATAMARMDGLRPVIEARYDSDGHRVMLIGDLCEGNGVSAREAARRVRAALDELRGLVSSG